MEKFKKYLPIALLILWVVIGLGMWFTICRTFGWFTNVCWILFLFGVAFGCADEMKKIIDDFKDKLK